MTPKNVCEFELVLELDSELATNTVIWHSPRLRYFQRHSDWWHFTATKIALVWSAGGGCIPPGSALVTTTSGNK